MKARCFPPRSRQRHVGGNVAKFARRYIQLSTAQVCAYPGHINLTRRNSLFSLPCLVHGISLELTWKGRGGRAPHLQYPTPSHALSALGCRAIAISILHSAALQWVPHVLPGSRGWPPDPSPCSLLTPHPFPWSRSRLSLSSLWLWQTPSPLSHCVLSQKNKTQPEALGCCRAGLLSCRGGLGGEDLFPGS